MRLDLAFFAKMLSRTLAHEALARRLLVRLVVKRVVVSLAIVLASVALMGASASQADAPSSDDGPPSGALVGGQLLASAGVKTSTTSPLARNAVCPEGTVEVQGDYCPYVEQKCLRWLDPETKMRCAEFAPTSECTSRTIKKHFCIDAYEYPNQPGQKPEIMRTWHQAGAACSAAGKRLCTDSEWTLSCEGQERLPYPYGYARNPDACNIDRPHPDPNEKLIGDPRTRDAEVQRLDQRDPSGAKEACVSPYGVHDMTGNVDEWVVNETGHPYKSGLKGGYWGPVRDRCRPMTTAHDENFEFYQIGFRCCSDPAASPTPAPEGRPTGATLAGS